MIEDAILAQFEPVQRELLLLCWRMLDAIYSGDAKTYTEMCAPDLTCYEEVSPYRIEGVRFHASLIHQMAEHPRNRPRRFDMVSPSVQVYGDSGIVTFTRLCTFDGSDTPRFSSFNETRVFVRIEDKWKLAHFHRSNSTG